MHEHYVVQGLGRTAIANMLGCDRTSIRNAIRRLGIEPHPADVVAHPKLNDQDWLRREYRDRERSCADIAAELGCHPDTVSRWLGKHQIPARPNTHRTPRGRQ